MVESNLLFKGSSGCVFRPQLKCQKKTRDKKKTKGTKRKGSVKTQKKQIWGKSKSNVTKLMFDRNNHEIDFIKIIKKIKNYSSWTSLWTSSCESPPYSELLDDDSINECLKESNVKGIDLDSRFYLQQGDYGGHDLNQHRKKTLSKNILTNQLKFNEYFIKLFRLMKNVFYGLTQLSKHGICHHDINIRNILIKKNKSYIIDYDISLKINKVVGNKFLKKRIDSEYSHYRIYEAYPFEYIYHNLDNRSDIIREQDNIKSYQSLIGYYELYLPINEGIFGIDTNKQRDEYLENKLEKTRPTRSTRTTRTTGSTNLTNLMRKLDIYSLGMMILIVFFDSGVAHNIQIDEIIKRLRDPELKPYMDLIRDMIQFRHQDRITCEEAYKRYLNLIR